MAPGVVIKVRFQQATRQQQRPRTHLILEFKHLPSDLVSSVNAPSQSGEHKTVRAPTVDSPCRAPRSTVFFAQRARIGSEHCYSPANPLPGALIIIISTDTGLDFFLGCNGHRIVKMGGRCMLGEIYEPPTILFGEISSQPASLLFANSRAFPNSR